MKASFRKSTALALLTMIALPATNVAAQDYDQQDYDQSAEDDPISVYGEVPSDLSDMAEGPDVEGMIAARDGNTIRVRADDGTITDVRISSATTIRARGGFLGLGREQLTEESLLNGLPVEIRTVQWGRSLIADDVRFSDDNLEMASMIRNGTAQGFAEQTAATDALRSRVGDLDNYNIRGTTNVYFDTDRWQLSPEAQRDLCQAAAEAEGTNNALLLVVGYTDSVGDQDYNQVLSERRAGRVVNFLQQECDWKPWRMLTPTGMAEADPEADNMSEAGRAQNRRVAVNILVSKAVEGL